LRHALVKHPHIERFKITGLSFSGTASAQQTGLNIPETSPFLAGIRLDDHDFFGSAYTTSIREYGQKPYLSLNEAQVVWPATEGIGHNREIIVYETLDFPFNFCVRVTGTRQTSVNKKTQNEQGLVLDHLAKVDTYKVPFKMLEHERAVFDAYAKEHKAVLKKHKDSGSKEEKPKKPSAHEPIYLGMELEAVCRGPERSGDGMRKLISDIAKSPMGEYSIIKHDGTTGDYGFELVTIPASLMYHKKFLRENFFDAPHKFHKRILATDRCGIHVHISKNALTVWDLRSLLLFINALENSAFINNIAGRPAGRYCNRLADVRIGAKAFPNVTKFVKRACSDTQLKKGFSFKTLQEERHGELHYNAVNVQNAHTVEIRIFKSSNDPNRIFRILEFCESLVKFVRAYSPQQMTVYDYVDFLLDKSNKKDYPNMIRWLASKNYIGHQRKKAKDPKTGKEINKLLNVYSENKVPFPCTAFHTIKNYPAYFQSLKETTKKKVSKTCV
jgi:hypothetical protein